MQSRKSLGMYVRDDFAATMAQPVQLFHQTLPDTVRTHVDPASSFSPSAPPTKDDFAPADPRAAAWMLSCLSVFPADINRAGNINQGVRVISHRNKKRGGDGIVSRFASLAEAFGAGHSDFTYPYWHRLKAKLHLNWYARQCLDVG